jgi:hypothetical protein
MRALNGVLRTFRMLERMCTCKFPRRVGVRLILVFSALITRRRRKVGFYLRMKQQLR